MTQFTPSTMRPMGRGGPASVAGGTCIKCGYDLAGLPQTGACPECGTPVADSLRGTLLRHSSPEYVAKLHRGVFMVVTAIIVQLTIGIGMFVLGLTGALFGGISFGVVILLSLVNFGMSLMLLAGWWLFSEPDPRYTGGNDGSTARKVLRVALAVYAAVMLLSLATDFLPESSAQGANAKAGLDALMGLIILVAWAVEYFASMRYVSWLAHRIPNDTAHRRARLLVWLGPVLITVGLLLLGLGPLIALVLYWNLLDQVRKDLKGIRMEQGTLAR